MSKSKNSFEKRQREVNKKKIRNEKLQRKIEKKFQPTASFEEMLVESASVINGTELELK